MDPKDAADYPSLPVDMYLIWRGNGSIWPSHNRSMVFLSGSKKQLDGSARFTREWTDAKTFPDRISASGWMADNRSKRGQAYDGAEITTVAELIARRFPSK